MDRPVLFESPLNDGHGEEVDNPPFTWKEVSNKIAIIQIEYIVEMLYRRLYLQILI